MSDTKRYHVEDACGRLDAYVAGRCPELTRSYIQRLIKEGRVTVGGLPAKASHKLHGGEVVALYLPPPAPSPLTPEDIPISIVYEDEHLVVVDKPAGLTVHPAPGHPRGTLVNALLSHCPDLAGFQGSLRPGIVHRLDKDTSGLLVVAKSQRAYLDLVRQMKERTVKKEYLALVHGEPLPSQGTIRAPLGRSTRDRKKMAVVAVGREAMTGYRVLRSFPGYSLLEVTPHTGRTHQIRVHLAWWGYPVAGDATYGRRDPFLGRQFLHASRLGFRHPTEGTYIEFASPLPGDLQAALTYLEALGFASGGDRRRAVP
ncbi:MAG: RluA family pseudouridine synthase [Chloroflexi bacterium]|nr:RluA family pseudouridine synthase [Chloroflexota bacterium]